MKKNVFEKRILFVTPYRYSGIPQYIAVLKNLKDKNIKTLYLDYNYPNDTRLNIEELRDNFHEIYQVRNTQTKGSTRITNRSIVNNIRNARILRKQILAFLDTKKPVAVISLSDLSIGDRIIFSWCKRKNVPFIILQPSVVEAKIESYRELSVKRLLRYVLFNVFLSSPLYSRQNLYANEAKKSYLLLWSKYLLLDRTRERVYIIGNPAFDKLFRNFSPKTKSANKIVICTELIYVFSRDIHSEIMKIYIAGVKAYPDLEFIIKVHPKESKQEYLLIFNGDDFPNVTVIKDTDLHKLYEKCDIQVSVNSTSTFEAAAMGLPTITVAPESIYSKITDLFKGKINIRVRNSREFISAIKKARSIKYREEFLRNRKEYFDKIMCSTDGLSGKRALAAIFEIIAKHPKKPKEIFGVR